MPQSPAEGAPAPDFRLPRDGGGTVSLADFKGRKLVLFFYPKADTSGCTIEAKDFSRLDPDFAKAGTTVIGVLLSSPVRLDSGRGMRNRWPSAETANVFQLPVWLKERLTYPVSNSGRGVENSSVAPAALTPAEINFPLLIVSM